MNKETIAALHALLMKAPDAQYDSATGMHWAPIEGCHGDAHDLADYVLSVIAAGKIPGVRPAPSVGPDPRDQWYPGADGVQTVQELWAYYCERGDQIAEIARLRAQLAEAEKERDSAQAAFRDLDASLHADTKRMQDAGLSYQSVRDVLREYDTAEASFGRMVELIRVAANHLAEKERDAAQARVGEMEGLLRECLPWLKFKKDLAKRIDAALATSPHRLAGRDE